jgi:hypothetical protein
MKTRALFVAALAGLALAAPLPASAQADPDPWKFSIMPYLWLPSVDGKLRYGPPPASGGSANVSIDTSTILDNLDFAFMINGEARKGRWLIGTDVIYLNFGHADSSVRSATFDFGPRGRITVGAGENSGTQSFVRQGSAEKSDNLWAGIVGGKGRVKLGASDWFVNYYADVGGWSNLFTWQGAAGIGYAFKWGDVIFDYRYLYYSQSGQDKLIDNISFGGFALGVNFRF